MAHICSPSFLPLIVLFILLFPLFPTISPANVTLLIPSKPDINQRQPKKDVSKDTAKARPPKTAPPANNDAPQEKQAAEPQESDLPQIKEEVDLLITRLTAFTNTAYAIDRPQSLTVLLYNKQVPPKDGRQQPRRRDLLGDVEEIIYNGKKAWGANVELLHPGLYQFVLETRPWWDEAQQYFLQHFVKVMLPVYGDDTGWEESAGQRFEIVPKTRPFGLLTPALFTGKVLYEGKAQPNCLVIIERINTDGQKVPTPWHQSLVLRSDESGYFSAILNRTGWWCCRALVNGAPLKGADGQPKTLQLEALYWFYVDSESVSTR